MAGQVALATEPFGLVDLEADLAMVRSTSGSGLYASGDVKFRDAVFGRDMAEAALDLLGGETVQAAEEIAREVILTMTKYLGTRDSAPGPNSNEERRGKAHHEHRALVMDGRPVSPASAEMCRRLAELWGGTENGFTYYGSADVTPQYIRLVAKFCSRHGDRVLDAVVVDKDGGRLSVREGVRRALQFLATEVEKSELGLLEYVSTNPRGLEHHSWTETSLAYLLPDGRLANRFQPIASVEIQGLTYDALVDGRQLVEEKLGRHLQALADRLQASTLEHFWMEECQYFAMAVDRDATSRRWRRIDAVSSKPGTLLDTKIFDTLGPAERRRYVEGVVRTIYSPQLLTPVGVRCRSLDHAGLHDLVDYHGVRVSWPKETNDVGRGLWQQGFSGLGAQLDARLLNGVNAGRGTWEFFLVDADGTVDYDPHRQRPARVGAEPTLVKAGNIPEQPQTWTVTAALEARARLRDGAAPRLSGEPWQDALEAALLDTLPQVELLTTEGELERYYDETGKSFISDLAGAWESEKKLMKQLYRRSFPGRIYEPDPVAESLSDLGSLN
jgi:hypothetical protein